MNPGTLTAISALLLSSACATRNQSDEIQRLRAELAAVTAERDQLKAQLHPPAPEAPPSAPEAKPTTKPAPTWDEAYAAYSAGDVDKSWRRLREHPVRKLAIAHIKETASSLNIVTCRASSCLIVVDVSKNPRRPYTDMANPWPACHLVKRTETLPSGKIRHSYLVTRHEKDYAKFGAERVDPFKTATPAGTLSTQSGDATAAAPAAKGVASSPTASAAAPAATKGTPPKAPPTPAAPSTTAPSTTAPSTTPPSTTPPAPKPTTASPPAPKPSPTTSPAAKSATPAAPKAPAAPPSGTKPAAPKKQSQNKPAPTARPDTAPTVLPTAPAGPAPVTAGAAKKH